MNPNEKVIDRIESRRILDRDLSKTLIAEYRTHAAPVLNEVVDEGIAVFERCLTSRTHENESLALPFLGLHVFEMLDGVSILLADCAPVPARLQMRSVFEAFLKFEYVNEAESERRGNAFMVEEIHRRIRRLRRFDPDSSEGKQMSADMLKDIHGRDIRLPFPESIPNELDSLQRLLEKPHLQEAAAEYDRRARDGKSRLFYSFWGGPANLEQLARLLGRPSQYEFMYREWSQTMHAEDLTRQLVARNGEPAVEVFRNPKDVKSIYNFSFTFGLATIRLLLERYRPGEINGGAMERWYRREVRSTFLKILGDNE